MVSANCRLDQEPMSPSKGSLRSRNIKAQLGVETENCNHHSNGSSEFRWHSNLISSLALTSTLQNLYVCYLDVDDGAEHRRSKRFRKRQRAEAWTRARRWGVTPPSATWCTRSSSYSSFRRWIQLCHLLRFRYFLPNLIPLNGKQLYNITNHWMHSISYKP